MGLQVASGGALAKLPASVVTGHRLSNPELQMLGRGSSSLVRTGC